ncbi:MAG: hypothetical protein KDG89_06160 [Geminicoccaceae bacterium]|nr:hypothetical protein [Geminicoccaceae bacterium]
MGGHVAINPFQPQGQGHRSRFRRTQGRYGAIHAQVDSVNSKNRSSMFPFRRGGGSKKRNRNNGGAGGQGRPFNPGKRQGGFGSGAELLPMLQPATKAVAQVLAGNTRLSGQLVQARNVLEQAERLVGDHAVERMPPAMREEFLEQLARLKLTLADAEAHEREAEADPDAREPEPPPQPVPLERLRALALSLAQPLEEPEVKAPAQAAAPVVEEVPAPEKLPSPEAAPTTAEGPPRPRRAGEVLRLKSTQSKSNRDDEAKVGAR